MRDIGPLARRGRSGRGAFGRRCCSASRCSTGDDRRLTAAIRRGGLCQFRSALWRGAGDHGLGAPRAPFADICSLRLAVANLHRPGALTPSFLISLGLGVTLLTALVGSRAQPARRNRRFAPQGRAELFLLRHPGGAGGRAFEAFLRKEAPDGVVAVAPMLRGRIVEVNGTRRRTGQGRGQGALGAGGRPGDHLFRSQRAEGSRLVAGEWWPKNYSGPPLVSMETGVAQGLGVKIGDTITVNVLGRDPDGAHRQPAQGELAQFRHQFRDGLFAQRLRRGAFRPPDDPEPAASARIEQREAALLADAAKNFPVGRQRVAARDFGDGRRRCWANCRSRSRSAASLAFVVSALVLAGALAAGRRARIYEAVVLKVLGATRGRLLGGAGAGIRAARRWRPQASAWRRVRWSRRWSRESCSISGSVFSRRRLWASRSARSPSLLSSG